MEVYDESLKLWRSATIRAVNNEFGMNLQYNNGGNTVTIEYKEYLIREKIYSI